MAPNIWAAQYPGTWAHSKLPDQANAIKTEKIIFKGRFAADSDLPTKILYAMEI